MIIKVPVVATINTDCGGFCIHYHSPTNPREVDYCSLFGKLAHFDVEKMRVVRCDECLEAEKKASKDNA